MQQQRKQQEKFDKEEAAAKVVRNYNLKDGDDQNRTEDSVLDFFHRKSHGKLNNDMGNIMEFGNGIGGSFAPRGSSPDNRKQNNARDRRTSFSPDYTKAAASGHMTQDNINEMIRPSAVGRKNAK